MLELHDRSRFQIIAYSVTTTDHSPMRSRLETGVDLFVEVAGLSAAAIADRMTADGVHILVDLNAHTKGGRLDVLALRPAPIQVNYLGYPGTVGAEFVDYILADPTILPMDRQPFYSERIVHLPHCYQANDRHRPRPDHIPDRTVMGLPARGAVLACFNAAYKITPKIFAAWMRILGAIPDAVLWLLADQPEVESALRREAGSLADRLIFAPRVPLEQHLSRYGAADLFLDTLPYNAHTTGSDALWMGCPMVTFQGESFAARVGASLLYAVGLPELVTNSLDQYESLAIDLLKNPDRLTGLRQRLEQGRDTAPLFHTPAFTKAMESAYETMWRQAESGQPLQAFAV